MTYSLAISELSSTPFKIRRIQLGKQLLSHATGRFQAVVDGRCLLDFAENILLSFEWVAVGQSDEECIDFNVQTRNDFDPQLDGATLVDGNGMPLTWREQSDNLIALVGALNWQEAVKQALARTCLVGADN